jgi:hypothetical protein
MSGLGHVLTQGELVLLGWLMGVVLLIGLGVGTQATLRRAVVIFLFLFACLFFVTVVFSAIVGGPFGLMMLWIATFTIVPLLLACGVSGVFLGVFVKRGALRWMAWRDRAKYREQRPIDPSAD